MSETAVEPQTLPELPEGSEWLTLTIPVNLRTFGENPDGDRAEISTAVFDAVASAIRRRHTDGTGQQIGDHPQQH